ncbi:MAG: folate-binding protein, partial [Pseudomonadota bacterium]|nr:folate-binding protein [Pseudomonadota bacterium]
MITVGGPDRRDFLQGLISNDNEQAGPGQAIWAALLTAQGKYLHDFFIIEIGDVFYIDCEAARLMDLGQRLSRFKLRAEIDLGIAEDFGVWALYGNDAGAAMGLDVQPGRGTAWNDGVVYYDPRTTEAGCRAILPKTSAVKTLECANWASGHLAEYDKQRIALGAPDGSRDMVIEKAILLENNFDPLNGVDWEKGCYVGQELTARTKYRGLIKKQLVPVEFDGETPSTGTLVSLSGKDAGEIRSVQGNVGL